MEYEIINPSDECYVSSDEDIVASAVVLFLGNGKYPLNDADDKPLPTFFMLGGDLEEAFKYRFGLTLSEFLSHNENLLKMANCCSSFRYARERSSTNNIGAAAKALEKQLRKRAALNTTADKTSLRSAG
jgi:hypothetical protein